MVVKNQTVKFIAEIGLNHNGSIDLAKKHVEKAKECGADIAKFQNYFAKTRAKENSPIYEILDQCELNSDQFCELKEFCDELEIEFASTPFCEKSAELLDQLKCSTIKIASFHLSHENLIKKILKYENCKKLILSTGVSSSTQMLYINNLYDEIENTKPEIAFLHCISEYPISQPSNFHLSNINHISRVTNKEVGFSDHSLGTKAPVYATLLGATIIEKHFTLDNELPGADHSMSANPEVFKKMIQNCNEANLMLGSRRLNNFYECEKGSVQFCVNS